jgi:RNA-directed DNA polymerase
MIEQLKASQSLVDLATVLGVEPKYLSYILYKIPDDQKYTTFSIPKKSGAPRTIHAPVARLRLVQTRLSELLYGCVDDLTKENPKLYRSMTGFKKGTSIADNAKRHSGRRFVFNIDLDDFFGSVHIGRVRGFFNKDRNFGLADRVALTIAQIACHEGKLPQGAPSSPIIANLVGSILDARLAKFAVENGCRYSRYADDLTFSTNLKEFPDSIAVRDEGTQGWVASERLISKLTNAGYGLNIPKTRMSLSTARQTVTGLTVNTKVNIPKEYHKNTRAMCHRLFQGNEAREDRFSLTAEEQTTASLLYVEGRLSYQYFIKNRFDLKTLKEKQDKRSSFDKTYRDFLLFKIFYRSQKKLVITEGESDSIYLDTAVKIIFPEDDDFRSIDDHNVRRKTYRVLARTSRLVDVLGLGGGTGNLIRAIVQLKDFSRSYPNLVPTQPVVILIDNDAGAKPFLKQVRSVWGASFEQGNSEPFLRIKKGLYVVRTPPVGGQEVTYIESFLPANVLNVSLGGKTFSPEDNFDTSAHFGKVRLAQYTATNAATINFGGYAPLLERVRAAWLDWQAS